MAVASVNWFEARTPELVAALLHPDAYPHHPAQVEIVQTQMSAVFLTGEYAYKIKKPVNLGYLDYTTLEKRLFFCQQELALNRRLSPDVYLDVVAVVRRGTSYAVEGEGPVVEHAVKMRQLPRDMTMDVLLLKGEITRTMVERLAEKIAAFHRSAETSPRIGYFGGVNIILQNNAENFEQTVPFIGKSVSREKFVRLKGWSERFIAEHQSLFEHRVREGRVRDCHGDLHSAHVCFTDGIVIFDCIEFNDRFRYCDVASEVAFLAMDMDHKGRSELGMCLVRKYMEYSGDEGLLGLIDFYKCYRAHVRGKVESIKLLDPLIPVSEKEQSLARSRGYFELAARYARLKPVLIIMSGLVGTGKSTVAEALGRTLGVKVFSSDVVRKEMAGVPLTGHRYDPFGKGIYSADFTERTYSSLLQRGEAALNNGESVILDASFGRDVERQKARGVARGADAGFMVVECRLSDERLLKERLESRSVVGSVSDGRWEILEEQKQRFDIMSGLDEREHMVADTSQAVELIVEEVVRRLC